MQVNILAVLLSAIASIVIGSIWYGPLFGKMFIKTMGWEKHTKEDQMAMMKGMSVNYVWQFIASVVMFYVLEVLMIWLGKTTAKGGVHTALLAWIGFIVPLKFGDSLWGGKKTLFWLGVGNSLITIVVGGIILGVWR